MINNRPPSASSTSIHVTITLAADTLYALISSSNSAFHKKHFCQHGSKISSTVFCENIFLLNKEPRNVNFMKIKSWSPIKWNFFHSDIGFLFLFQVVQSQEFLDKRILILDLTFILRFEDLDIVVVVDCN